MVYISRKEELRRSMRERAMHDLFYLCREILEYRDLHDDFHRRICAWFQQEPKYAYRLSLVSRGHFKTTIGTVGHSLQRWLINPMERICGAHAKGDQMILNLDEIQFHLTHNEKFRFIAPDICWDNPEKDSDMWLKDRIRIKRPQFSRVPSFLATGIGGSVVGLHFDRFKLDDLVIYENSQTPDQRQKVIEYIKALRGLFRDPSRVKVDVIGTRWHMEDAYQWLLDTYGGKHGRLDQLILSCYRPDGTPWFDTRFTEEVLQDTRTEMGSYVFSGQMLNNPVPEDTKSFDETKVQLYDPYSWPPVKDDGTPYSWNIYTACDPNRKMEEQHDPGVVLTVARNDAGNYYVLECSYEKFSVRRVCHVICDHVERWSTDKAILEMVAGQHYLMEPLQEVMAERGLSFPIDEAKRPTNVKKFQRIIGLQPLIEQERLHLPTYDHPLYDEIKNYPFGGRRVADHCLDALADVLTLGYTPRARQPHQASPDPWSIRALQEHRSDQRPWQKKGLRLAGAKW